METNRVVSRDEWLSARKKLLEREKAHTHEKDAITKARQALPMVKVEKNYVFDGEDGKRSLRDLFGDKTQLVIYHFMFAPDWDAGCKSCSLVAETFDRVVVHLAQRDTAFTAVSRAPLEKLLAFRKRLGFTFPWVSSAHNEFNYDWNVSFHDEKNAMYNYRQGSFPTKDAPGFSSFLREGNDVFHTYSTFGRGVDELMNVYRILDLTPHGRNEDGKGMFWVKRRDEY